MTNSIHGNLPRVIRQSMQAMGLLRPAESIAAHPLTGGVSSDIWRVQTAKHTYCAKRALPQLKVTQSWTVPIERNAYEVAWLETVEAIAPGRVPQVLGHDVKAGVFVMEYLEPADYPVWKNQLRDGLVSQDTGGQVTQCLAAIHSATAHSTEMARRFATDELFFALRMEPYLLATAARHPDLESPLRVLTDRTMAEKKALVHGDVSPKNILVGPRGPVFVDAECAWYGDPAFDLAFCLNHLLLKCLWNPACGEAYLRCFAHMVACYLAGVDWEPTADFEMRVAHLLPGLMLARIDGKSPVEYLKLESDRDTVRDFARRYLLQPCSRLAQLVSGWEEQLLFTSGAAARRETKL